MSFFKRCATIGTWRSHHPSSGISSAPFIDSGDRMYLMRIDDQSLAEFLLAACALAANPSSRNRFARSVMTSLLITVGAPHSAERRPEDELLIVVEESL